MRFSKLYAQITEMALPRVSDTSKSYYHGTDDINNALGILREKKIKIPSLEGRETKMTPVKGKVYITPSLHYAQIYAIGGDFAGHEAPDNWLIGLKRFGFLFTIPGNEIKDIQPDEDNIGKTLYECLNGKKNLPWLVDLAQRHLSPYLRKKVKAYDDYADFAKAGKILVKHMTDAQKLQLIDQGAHIAHGGDLSFSECWMIEKNKTKDLKSDGSNFFDFAKRVDLTEVEKIINQPKS